MSYILPPELQKHYRINNHGASHRLPSPLIQKEALSLQVRLALEFSTLREIADAFTNLTTPDALNLLNDSLQKLKSLTLNDAQLYKDSLRRFAEIAAQILRSAATHERNERLAAHDSPTELLNLRAFRHALLARLAASQDGRAPFAVFYINIDDFSALNRRFGFINGDLILRQFARLLRENLPQTKTLARAHTDVFLALLPDVSPAESSAIAEDLQAALETHIFTLADEQQINLMVSIGATHYPADGDTLDQLLARAAHRSHKQRDSRRRPIPSFLSSKPASNSNILPFPLR